MAITQAQVDQWFAANPNATAQQVADAVEAVGGLTPELSSILATKYETSPEVVSQQYQTLTAPTYFEQRPDVAAAYTPWSSFGSGLTPEQFATAHYNLYGANEGGVAPTVTGATIVPDYQTKYYDVATLDKLVSELSKYTNPANLQGGALGTSKGNIGFDYNALTSALGRDITTQDQVLFDAARGLINMGITDPTKVQVKQNTTTNKPDLYYNGQLIKEGIESLNLGSTATGEGITHYSLNLAGEPTFTTKGQKTGGIGFTDVRDLVQAAAVVAGNYFLPGSSIVTSQLVTDGAKQHLSSDIGQAANLVAGASGGAQGNMSNYGKIGDAAGLTSPTVTPTGAEGGAATGATTGSTTGGTMLDYSMPTAQGGLGLQGTAALDGTLSSGLAAPAGGSLGGGLGLTASTAGNLSYMGGAQGLTANAAGGGTLSAGGVNTGLFTPDNLYNSSIGTGGTPSGTGTKITASDVIKTLPLVNTVATLVGGADTGGGGPTGTTGFKIVPMPESWKPPTYSQSTQAPIDLNSIFTNQNLLTGTQWEGLPNQRNLTFNDIFAAGQQSTPMGNPVNLNNIVSAILGQSATSQKPA